MNETLTLEIPIAGMDCDECTLHVRHALERLPGVRAVEVYLGAEKAVIELTENQAVDMHAIRSAVSAAGYSVPEEKSTGRAPIQAADFNRRLVILLAVLFVSVPSIAIFGEWMGAFAWLNNHIPFWIGLLIVAAGGYPVFLNVIRSALKRQVIAHTLMCVGVIAALLVGQWATAAVVVVFMRIGDYVEKFTTESARRALRELSALSPQTALVERAGGEQFVPAGEVLPGEIVIIRPGEAIPVDGEVVSGQATVNQAAITGESMPVEVAQGSQVYAASLARLGSIRVRALRSGSDTTFGRVISMVEQAEANRAQVQRFADRFGAWYLPVVGMIAAATYLFSHNPLHTAAVLLVACSCSITLSTPVAMLASIGASARRGLLIKGGKYLETLERANVLLVDKTGTLTFGDPQVTDVLVLDGTPRAEVIGLASAAERRSEHPLATAILNLAAEEGITPGDAQEFRAIPGQGVSARVDGRQVRIGNSRLLPAADELPQVLALENAGKTLLILEVDGRLCAIFAAADALRPGVADAIRDARALGIQEVEILTGDNARSAAPFAAQLGVKYRAGLLPEDKIAIVRQYQAQGKVVVMVGDGVNDAPALAQADVGIAMGAAGSDIAIAAAHIALMREDWSLVPEAMRIAQRTMRIVRMNLFFSALYNLGGLTLAAGGILTPVLAAAAQSLPDLGIMGNSARLLRHKD